MNIKFFSFFALTLLVLAGCYKAPNYPDEPYIAIQGVYMSRAVPMPGDSVVVVLEFRDGNGDLGKKNQSDTIPNLFITDKRFGITDSLSFSIPHIPAKGSVKDISGEISLNLLSKIYCNPLFPDRQNDTLEFEIQVRDRAGLFSNKVTTGRIVMQCH